MRDKNSEKRFIVSLLVSILIHLLIVMAIYGLSKLMPKKSRLQKIDASNLLILKRGRSLDKTKNAPGSPPPSLASKNTPQNPSPSMPSLPSQKTAPSQKTKPKKPQEQEKKEKNQTENADKTTQKKQKDSEKKSLNPYQNNYVDPKNLSLLSKEQALALQSPAFAQSAPANGNNDQGVDPQTRKDIDELYGEEFGDLGTAEKDYIKNNLREIGRITQKYLEYPRTAAYLGQDGQNAVEFYLHPNGDITDLKIITPSGSVILDRNTVKTIQIAYKDYPRPSVKTLIRIRVRYFMY